MKPAYIGLLVLLATALLGIFAFMAFTPRPLRALAEPATRTTMKSTQPHPRRDTKTTERKSTSERGVFSGADPNDPRIYH
jgi:hypothetical protein